MKKKIKLLICICTKNRKKKLSKTIKSISELSNNYKAVLNILIVENNKKISIKKKSFKLKNVKSTKIVLEKKIGISSARNRCLKEAKKLTFDYLVFFDDDCLIDKYWLNENLKFLNETKFDVVTGPHISLNNTFLNLIERKFKNKKKIRWASTNNVLIKRKVLNKENLIFDHQIQKIGGEDQLFFLKLNNKGYEIGWNDNSKVYDLGSKHRNKFNWFIKRSFGYGCSSYFIYKKIYIRTYVFIIFMKIFYDLINSLIYFILSPIKPRKFFLKSTYYFFRFLGCFTTTFFGFTLKRY